MGRKGRWRTGGKARGEEWREGEDGEGPGPPMSLTESAHVARSVDMTIFSEERAPLGAVRCTDSVSWR
jgi:hypothetical protein